MRNMLQKARLEFLLAITRLQGILRDRRGEGFVDTAIKILISIVIGALLLAGLYFAFQEIVLPTLNQRIQDMFNYTG